MILFGPRSEYIEKLNHIRVTQSLQGVAVPIVAGTQRVPGLLVWNNDFASHKQSPGGKGKKGTLYTYTGSWISVLAEGPIQGVSSVWDQSGRFAAQYASTTFNIPNVTAGQPNVTAPSTNFAADRGVILNGSSPTPMRRVFYDALGGDSVPTLSSGQYAVDASGGYYFSNADVGATVTVENTYYYSYRITQELHQVPSAQKFTADHGGVGANGKDIFREDLGVRYYPSGTALTQVSSNPGAGEYTISINGGIGTYGFSLADVAQQVLINYEYDNYQDDKYAPRVLSVTFYAGLIGQGVWSYLDGSHPDQAVSYSGSAYAAFENGYLGMSAVTPINSYELTGFDAIGGGVVDCSIIDFFKRTLTDANIGIGFPSSYIDNASWYNAQNSAQNWIRSQGLLMSQALLNQESVTSYASRWLEAFNVAAFWSEGLLKLVPYGDQSVSGNGFSYTPNTGIVAEFTDDDYLGEGGERATEPIIVERSPWTEAWNRTQVNYLSRINDYNPDIAPEQDEGSIERFGLRIEPPVPYDFITTVNVAAAAANMRVKRHVTVRNKYHFSVATTKAEHVEPMDLIKITDTRLGIVGLPVRVVRTANDPPSSKRGIAITAEDFPGSGYAMPVVHPKSNTPPLHPVAGSEASLGTSAVVLEVTNQTPNRTSTRLYFFCVGDSPNWGGCIIWLAEDNVNFHSIGTVRQAANIGNLLAAVPAVARNQSGSLGLTYDNTSSVELTFGAAKTNASTAGVPQWNSLLVYSKGMQVVFDSQLWVAIATNQNSQPTSSNPNWQLVSDAQPANVGLASVTDNAAAALTTLSALIALGTDLTPSLVELFSYVNVAAGSYPNIYTLTDLYRGAYGSKISSFPVDAQFVELNHASAVYDVAPGLAGKTVSFRFTAFNQVTGAVQDLGNVDTYTFTIQAQGDSAADFGPGVSSAFNSQGSQNATGDNSAFLYSFTDTEIALWWNQFTLPRLDGTSVSVAGQGSSSSPAKVFSGLTASTTYYVSARYNLATDAVEMIISTGIMTLDQVLQWYNADGYIPIFGNWQLATDASGGSGGGGSGSGYGNSCFSGDALVKTASGWKRFDELKAVETIVNETGTWEADLIVHEQAKEVVLPLHAGFVTVGHPMRWLGAEGWALAGALVPGPASVYSGKLYNLHVRSEREADKHYIVDGRFSAHNYKLL